MSADGTWKLVMKTPLGERKASLALKDADGALSGKMTNEEGISTDIFEGRATATRSPSRPRSRAPCP